MAFTNDPRLNTQSQHTLPTFYNMFSPIGDDALATYIGNLNLVPTMHMPYIGGEHQQVTALRPPLIGTVIDSANTNGLTARGVYVWQKTSSLIYYFVVCLNKVYTSTDGTTWAAVTTLTTSASTPVGFTEFISDINVKSLILVDGIEGYVFTSNAAGTKIVDVDFPSPHLPFPVFIDGYIFLAKTDTGDIYNCTLNTPATWVAGDFISSELYPDDLKALAKINNYLLAIGSQGCEYFYDSANSTGSPLSRVDGSSHPFGTFYPYSLAVNKDTLIMLANTNDGEMSLQMVRDMEAKDITPTFLMERITNLIDDATITGNNLWGFFVRMYGDLYYVLNFQGGTTGTAPSRTGGCIAYNLELDTWSEFSINGTSIDEATQLGFPATCSTQASSTSPVTYVCGMIRTAAGAGPFFAKFTNGAGGLLGLATDTVTNSNCGGNIFWQIKTPPVSFGTLNRKTMSRLGLDVTGNSESSSLISISWNDFDYETSKWTTNVTLNVSSGITDIPYPFIDQLGQFRKRALKISGTSTYIMYIYGIQVDIDKGPN